MNMFKLEDGFDDVADALGDVAEENRRNKQRSFWKTSMPTICFLTGTKRTPRKSSR